ncbi:uncharacterized protein LOC116263795 [Nymphaea colorata]|nr:uncharacterized protein LOC116263795 [Nymphaea colorata]
MLRASGMSLGMGRKFGSARRDRLIGNFGCPAATLPAGSGNSGDLFELAEDDVWSSIIDAAAAKEEVKRQPAAAAAASTGNRRWPSSSEGSRRVGGLSLVFEEPAGGGKPAAAARIIHLRPPEDPPTTMVRHSAPVNVPDWSKILQGTSTDSSPEYDVGFSPSDNEGEWVPPHEYLARHSTTSRSTATSVFEGVGRTLKGRDMSRVRNAVWRQTGFFG